MKFSMRHLLHALGCAALACALPAVAQEPGSRGQLLYETHCVECHNTEVHWRDKRLVHDWATLKEWVDRWQREARLAWSDGDVDAVAHYLNATVYRLAEPQAAR